MPKLLLRPFIILVALAACSPASHNSTVQTEPAGNPGNRPATTSSTIINQLPSALNDSLTGRQPDSLMSLPQTDEGEIVLSSGFYQADFRSYCLQPGTPGPSGRESYLQAPLSGYRKDIVGDVLRNSLSRPDLEQRNIQLLLWSVVSGSDFERLPWEVQNTASQLLTRKQIFELRGGVMGVAKKIAATLPETGPNGATNKLKQLFETGNSSYELYERIAVAQQAPVVKNPEIQKDRWYKQQGGYYLRYLPTNYQHVKIQVYVPDGVQVNTTDPLLFDPVTTMAIPAASNSQRLGIGAPITDVIRKIIKIERRPPPPAKVPVPVKKNPKMM